VAQPAAPQGPRGPHGGAATPGVLVPRPHEPAGRGEGADAGRGLPGPGEHHQPGPVRPDGHALRPAQAPAAGRPRGSGECAAGLGSNIAGSAAQCVHQSAKATGQAGFIFGQSENKIVFCTWSGTIDN